MTGTARFEGRGQRKAATLRRFGVACAVVVAGLGLHAAAQAQTTLRTNVERPKGERSASQFPLFVSYDDCVNDNGFVFTVDLTGIQSGETLGVWISESTDCKLGTERSGSNARCRELVSIGSPQQVTTVELSAKQIAAAIYGTDSCDVSQGNTQPRPARIFFLRYLSTQEDVAAGYFHEWTQTSVDLLGPQAPINLTAEVGEKVLVLKYDTETQEEDLGGFRFYCDDGSLTAPVGTGGSGGSGGGGTGGTGGSGTGGSGTGGSGTGGTGGTSSTASGGSTCEDCTSRALTPGELPPAGVSTCGSVSGPSFTGEAKDLTNGQCYRVAVAGVDDVGNIGRLSGLACATPANVDDFFEVYREAGGQAGGGFCSAHGPGLPRGVGAALAAAGLAGAALGLRRRRQRGRKEDAR